MTPTRTVLSLSPSSNIPCFLVRACNPAEVSYDKESRVFLGEASTMQWAKGSVALRSNRTQAVMFFDNAQPIQDIEGDVTCWNLTSKEGMTLRIFNT